MGIQIRESTIEEIEEKLKEMSTPLNKLAYLESALRESGFSFEIKRFIFLIFVLFLFSFFLNN